ncbi:P2Y purinoceptor 3-like [Petromyzon marinus]|nr:P2Y purinoceptor 3-like [Petromyzon marinus]
MTNGSNCTLNESYKFIYLPVAYSVSAFFGIIFNGFIFCRLVCKKKKKLNSSSLFTVNLAATDFLYAMSLVFLIHSYVVHDNWVFKDFMCRLVRFMFYFNLNVSVLFLTAISLYRYLGICHPMSTLRWQRRKVAIGICAFVWVVTIAESVPTLYFSGVTLTSRQEECWDFKPNSSLQDKPYSVTVIFTGFVFPFIVTLVFYSCIIHTLKNSLSLGSVRQDVKRVNAIRTIIVVLVIFIICHLPYNISKLVFFFSGGNSLTCEADALVKTYKSMRGLVSLNCALNPIVYFVKQRKSCRDSHVKTRTVFATISSNAKNIFPSLWQDERNPNETN